jgi:hypothetical protein
MVGLTIHRLSFGSRDLEAAPFVFDPFLAPVCAAYWWKSAATKIKAP